MKHGVLSNLTPLGIFGDAIARTVIPPVAEASDLLAQTMLQMCNCDPYHMVPFTQRGRLEVKVCSEKGREG
jgi:hypothetical protein